MKIYLLCYVIFIGEVDNLEGKGTCILYNNKEKKYCKRWKMINTPLFYERFLHISSIFRLTCKTLLALSISKGVWDYPNFKPLNIGANFNVKAYALCVYLELNRALKGLVEETGDVKELCNG